MRVQAGQVAKGAIRSPKSTDPKLLKKDKRRHVWEMHDLQAMRYEIDFMLSVNRITALVKRGDLVVARAYVKINGKEAELVDIIVHNEMRLPSKNLWNRLFHMRKENFRNRGIGSVLLRLIILEISRVYKVELLWGQTSGCVPKLKRWYTNNGFIFNDDTHEIRLYLQ